MANTREEFLDWFLNEWPNGLVVAIQHIADGRGFVCRRLIIPIDFGIIDIDPQAGIEPRLFGHFYPKLGWGGNAYCSNGSHKR